MNLTKDCPKTNLIEPKDDTIVTFSSESGITKEKSSVCSTFHHASTSTVYIGLKEALITVGSITLICITQWNISLHDTGDSCHKNVCG